MPVESMRAVTGWKEPERLPFREEVCLPFLLQAQNPDGGWGYHPKATSSVEPTSWATLALREEPGRDSQALERATRWLRETQMAEGCWPAAAGQHPGCWVTALAGLALWEAGKAPEEAIVKGVQWLLDTWPAEGNLWSRLLRRVRKSSGNVVRQNHALRGWSWTPGTASWVEPTAYALILLRKVPEKYLPKGALRRCRLGERMLYDRMCPGGGWNAGNPMVYGVAGEPRISPTVWALLALVDQRDRMENEASLDWLERNYANISGPGSLALAHLCIEASGRPGPRLESRLADLYAENHFFQNVVVAAWACLALGSIPAWLRNSSGGGFEA